MMRIIRLNSNPTLTTEYLPRTQLSNEAKSLYRLN